MPKLVKGRDLARPINVQELADAIAVVTQIAKNEAREAAQTVLNYFGHARVIRDHVVEPDDRALFYHLEKHGLLRTGSDSYCSHLPEIPDLALRSVNNYWQLDPRKIRISVMSVSESKSKSDEQQPATTIYDEMPEEVWSGKSDEE